MLQKFLQSLVTAVIAVALSACGGGGGSSSSKITLSITDAPIDGADALVVVFTGVELKPAGGEPFSIDFETPMQIDLMGLTEGQTDNLLTNQEVTPGEYNWVRLKVDEAASFITVEGADEALEIPSNAQTGLKVNRNFTVAAGGVTRFTIDFDLRKSVHMPSCEECNYVLRPTLRFIDNLEVGTLTGSVDSALLSATEGCIDSTGAVKAVIYIFTGSDIVPDDIDGIDPDPITTAFVGADGSYTAAFLEAADYTVSLTCQAQLDVDPLVSEEMAFVGSQNATVVVDETTVVPAFTAPPPPPPAPPAP